MIHKTLIHLSLSLACLSIISPLRGENDKGLSIRDKKEDFHIFILMGQSNMAGYGKIEPDDRKPVPRVFKIPTRGKRDWVPASHPLHNRLSSDRFGLGLPFSVSYLKDKPGVQVGLIPMAWGGAPIRNLNKGTKTYRETIEKARLATQRGTLKGVLWHQGESDTVKQADSDSYERTLHQLISDLRVDLGDDSLPFIVGNLAEFYGTGKDHRTPKRLLKINKVRNVLRDLPNEVANTGFVASTDCSSYDKHMVHFDRRSYIILGQRYAQAFAKVCPKNEQTGTVQPTTAADSKSKGQ